MVAEIAGLEKYERFSLTPALSRWEREDLIQSLKQSSDWMLPNAHPGKWNTRLLFPLPAGEGQGEGERGNF